jgi:hypothetical protein
MLEGSGRTGGFAMIDSLVALLLLAVAFTGACTVLLRGMRASQEALLTTLAADLAADLDELLEIHADDGAGQLLAEWRQRVGEVLPVAGLAPEEFASLEPAAGEGASLPALPLHLLTIRWRGPGGQDGQLVLPLTHAADDA